MRQTNRETKRNLRNKKGKIYWIQYFETLTSWILIEKKQLKQQQQKTLGQ